MDRCRLHNYENAKTIWGWLYRALKSTRRRSDASRPTHISISLQPRRRGRKPPRRALALSPIPWPHLLLGIFCAALSGPRAHRHSGHFARLRIPPASPSVRCAAVLVCAYTSLDFLQQPRTHGNHLGRTHCLSLPGRERRPAPRFAHLFCLLPFLYRRLAGLRPVSIRRHVARGRIPLALPRSYGPAPGPGPALSAVARGNVSPFMGVVPHLLPVRGGQAAERRPHMAQPHRDV